MNKLVVLSLFAMLPFKLIARSASDQDKDKHFYINMAAREGDEIENRMQALGGDYRGGIPAWHRRQCRGKPNGYPCSLVCRASWCGPPYTKCRRGVCRGRRRG